MKICTKCKEEKHYESFYKSKPSKDGLQRVCKICQREYQQANKEATNARSKAWKERNSDRVRETSAKWRADNKEAHHIATMAWRRENATRHKEKKVAWNKANPEKVNSMSAKRRATKLNATPSWLTQEQLNQIADMYWLARDLEAISGQQYHVDHIVPLQGNNVCGLHVPWNLQVLPSDINIAKHNKHVA